MLQQDMAQVNHSVLMEDSRFKEIKSFSKKELPHQLHWFLKEDYFSNELIGLYFSEIEKFQHIAIESFNLFDSEA